MEGKTPWVLHDRIFSEDHMYNFIQRTSARENLTQTEIALPLMKKLHEGQTRKGAEKIPYIYPPLLMACHACALGLKEDDLLATILLHDVCEDCGVTPEELPVNENVRKTVELLTFEIREGETDEDAHERYFTAIKTNRLAVIVKIIDRCNNLSTMMGSFDRERMIEYIEETEKYVFPLMDLLKFGYDGKYYDVAFLIKYHLLSVVHNDKHALTLL